MNIKSILVAFVAFISISSSVIAEEYSDEVKRDAMNIIQAYGYTCSSIDHMSPFLLSGSGFKVTCNNYRYMYEIEDKGGRWVVTVK